MGFHHINPLSTRTIDTETELLIKDETILRLWARQSAPTAAMTPNLYPRGGKGSCPWESFARILPSGRWTTNSDCWLALITRPRFMASLWVVVTKDARRAPSPLTCHLPSARFVTCWFLLIILTSPSRPILSRTQSMGLAASPLVPFRVKYNYRRGHILNPEALGAESRSCARRPHDKVAVSYQRSAEQDAAADQRPNSRLLPSSPSPTFPQKVR